MEFTKAKLVNAETKSVQEIEAELLAKQEAESKAATAAQEQAAAEAAKEVELKDEDVISYLGKKFNREIKSFDDLVTVKEPEPLPEDVSAFLKYKRETGRGVDDFVKLQRDYDKADPDTLLREFYSQTETELDKEDIEAVFMSKYKVDTDLDDEATVRLKGIEKKKDIAKAKKYFNDLKDKYKAPLESSVAGLSQEEKDILAAYKEDAPKAKSRKEKAEKQSSWFEKKTEEVFSTDFKGFEFDVEGTKLQFTPGEAAELKKLHSSPMNFVKKYLDDEGLLKDAAGYHKALAAAMNPDKFAKFFYEQGMAHAKDEALKKMKNINMGDRRVPETAGKGGTTVKLLDAESGNGLKIKKIKLS